ncbi:unnamed protein product [Menidia menidia]|uniref:(Atlantic silverside) hypothetical protein n=1 Tax=Menidia menidia TaxID=238744 RepID=A0A8S4A849_9TELE|nr:unnamed protein product [Menidia menidia]
MEMFRKRSVVWSYFKDIDSSTVQCVICSGFLLRNSRGSTTPMLRHLRLKHTVEVLKSNIGRVVETGASVDHKDIKVEPEQFCSVEVALEDGDSDTLTTVNDSDHSTLLKASNEGPAVQMLHAEARCKLPVRHTRRRSLIWRLFEQLDSSDAARCRICAKRLHVSGGISNLRRHLSKRHPKVLSELLANGQKPPAEVHNSNANGGFDAPFLGLQQRQSSAEVALQNRTSTIITALKETVTPVMNGFAQALHGDAAQPEMHAGESDDWPERGTRRHSLIWRHFERLDSLDSARCRICQKTLQCLGGYASGNLRRHLLNKHPKLFSELVSNEQQPLSSNSAQDPNADEISEGSWETPVEVVLDDDDSDVSPVSESDNAVDSGLVNFFREQSVQQMAHSDESNHGTRRRSLIWRHFERLEGLNAARCLICMKKLQYFLSGGTGNLHRHLSKRHPKVFSELFSNWKHPSPLNLSLSPHGELNVVSGTSAIDRGVFSREMELIEALRRTQREEARTLEQQRELLEKLRAASAREAEAEREKIESLRKAQQLEAKDLSRQREELEMEKAELQKKWEELHQEREKLKLHSRLQEKS